MNLNKEKSTQLIIYFVGFTGVVTSFVNCSTQEFSSQALRGPASIAAPMINDSVKSTNVLEQSANLEFKLYSEINGERREQLYRDEPVHGVVVGASKDSTYTCVMSVLDRDACENPERWTKLPNNEWSFDESRQAWIMNSNLNHLLPTDEIGVIRVQDRKNNLEATAGIYLSNFR